MGRMTRRLQARAKRNVIVHAASVAPCSSHRESIASAALPFVCTFLAPWRGLTIACGRHGTAPRAS